jgi:FtsP/CotA-like multicopper oxidase with cupredoxin domain
VQDSEKNAQTISFTNPEIVERFVFHCHVVKHEDNGLMMTVKVVQ